MPHDANGNLLKVGDKVLIPGTITSLTESNEYCNCSVELDYAMPPYAADQKTFLSSVNTKQLLLAPVQAETQPDQPPEPPTEVTADGPN